MISLLKNLESSVTRASEIIGSMPYFTSFLPLDTRRPPSFPFFFCLKLISWILSLREMDIELMRRLSPRVNVIPVIGKADSLTPSELRGFKKRVSPLVSEGTIVLTS